MKGLKDEFVSKVSQSNVAFIEPARDFLRARWQAAEACMHQAARKQAGAQGRATRGREVKAWGGASGPGGRSWGGRGGVGTQRSSPNALICGEEWWKGSNIEKWGGARRARWCAREGGERARQAGAKEEP